MPRLMVAQGEIGVIHPGNTANVTELATFGASPCVILGIQKGTTALMAHIHCANNIKLVMEQIDAILGDARPAIAAPSAFIATETYDGEKHGELAQQSRMIAEIEQRLGARTIPVVRNALDKSVAVINAQGFFLYKPGPEDASGITYQEAVDAADWAEAYDKVFQDKIGILKMAIRVGKNTEAPAQAMSRLYG